MFGFKYLSFRSLGLVAALGPILVVLVLFSGPLGAVVLQEGSAESLDSAPLCFGAWKDQQVLEAQNRAARVSNALLLVSQNGDKAVDSVQKVGPSKSDSNKARNEIMKLEKELHVAQEQLQFARELTPQDYIAVYLQQFRDDEAALEALAQKMSPTEIKELLRHALRGGKSIGQMMEPIYGRSAGLQKAPKTKKSQVVF